MDRLLVVVNYAFGKKKAFLAQLYFASLNLCFARLLLPFFLYTTAKQFDCLIMSPRRAVIDAA